MPSLTINLIVRVSGGVDSPELLETIQRSIKVMSDTTDRLNAATDKIVAATTAVQEATDTMQAEVGAAIASLKDQIANGNQDPAIQAAVDRLEAAAAALTATKEDLATTLAAAPEAPPAV